MSLTAPPSRSRTKRRPLAPAGSIAWPPRGVVAAIAGTTCVVEWSDTLDGSPWSSTGVSESIHSGNGTLQQIKTTLPAGSAGRRFVRLRVTVAP